MFYPMSFQVDKQKLKDYFWANYHRSIHHKTDKSEITFWRKLFDTSEVTDKILKQLNIEDLNVSPRFSYQPPFTTLPLHIDIDRIVGVNINLMPDRASIHMRGIQFSYECAMLDVGAAPHAVYKIPTDRLVLKLAIRAPWNTVKERVSAYLPDSCLKMPYNSVLKKTEEHLVKL